MIWNNAITRSKAHPVQNYKTTVSFWRCFCAQKVRKDLSSYRSFRCLHKKNCQRNSMDSWWWFRVSKSDVFYIWIMRSRYQSDHTRLFTISKRRSGRRRSALRFSSAQICILAKESRDRGWFSNILFFCKREETWDYWFTSRSMVFWWRTVNLSVN